jgi:predicted RNA-binding Zn-ribbon protein involved in translation (DUF1610 family)
MFQTIRRTLRSDQTLKLQCEACDHRLALSAAQARAACGPDATPMDIRRRAKCRVCGAEGQARVWI